VGAALGDLSGLGAVFVLTVGDPIDVGTCREEHRGRGALLDGLDRG
jgi:hypothetical protein